MIPNFEVRPPVKVLVVIESLGFGGAEQALVTLLPELRARNIESQVVTLWLPSDLAPALAAKGIPVHELHVRHRWAIPEALPKLARVCRRTQPAIIWGHLYFGTLYSRLLKLVSPGVAVLSSLHSLTYAQFPPSTISRRLRAQLDALTGRYLADRTIAVSQAVADDYARHLNWPRTGVIYNPIPSIELPPLLARQRAITRNRFGVPEDAFVIVLPGRHTPEKGHAYLLQAMGLLKEQRGLAVHLVAPGNGPLRSELWQLAESSGVSDEFHLVDPLPQADLFDLLRSADAVVTPSLFEGYGIAAGEAMALGLPLVATRVGGFTELVEEGKTGLLVPPADPTALASAIWSLHEDPALRSRLGASAKQRVAERFGVGMIADQWERELRSLARRLSRG